MSSPSTVPRSSLKKQVIPAPAIGAARDAFGDMSLAVSGSAPTPLATKSQSAEALSHDATPGKQSPEQSASQVDAKKRGSLIDLYSWKGRCSLAGVYASGGAAGIGLMLAGLNPEASLIGGSLVTAVIAVGLLIVDSKLRGTPRLRDRS